MKELFKHFQGALMALIFLGYLVSSFAFAHVHIVDGVRIVHSHPYNDEHQDEGTHTDSEMLLYKVLANSFVVEVPEITSLQIPFCPVHFENFITSSPQLYSQVQLTTYLRGPPCLS